MADAPNDPFVNDDAVSMPISALIDVVREAVEDGDRARLDDILEPVHPADIADIIEQLQPARRRAFLEMWSGEMDGDVLSEIDENIREEVLDALPASVVADAVRDMDSDDVVDLIEDLETADQDVILSALDAGDQAAVRQSLAYPEDSAGRLMQSEIVTAPEHWTVGDAIDFLRSEEWLPEQFYHVILIDPRMRPVGYVTLGRMLSSGRSVLLTDLVEESFHTINVNQEEGEVAHAFNKYHLISAPVVDDFERLVGVITIDDAMSVLDDEAGEDILRLAGVGEDSAISDTVFATVRQRLPWLVVNLATAVLASLVISIFESTIQGLVALAVLMPIVASMGGNAGTQTLTVAVRALATKDLTGGNVWRVVGREATVGLINGLFFAIVMGVVAYMWFDIASLGAVIACAMIVNLALAALAGILIPLTLEKVGADPALASGTFVTTVTDIVGFFAFLGLARIYLI